MKVDPQAVVVSPPATGFPGIKWLPEFLSKGGRYVDVIGYHFYLTPRPPEATLQLVGGESGKSDTGVHRRTDQPC